MATHPAFMPALLHPCVACLWLEYPAPVCGFSIAPFHCSAIHSMLCPSFGGPVFIPYQHPACFSYYLPRRQPCRRRRLWLCVYFSWQFFHGERVWFGLSFRVEEVCGVQRVGVVRYVSSYGHVQRKNCESTVEVEDGHPICVHFGSVVSPLVYYVIPFCQQHLFGASTTACRPTLLRFPLG